MNYSMVQEAKELAEWSEESEAFSVYQALEKLPDPRRAQGKRSSLALILTCILLAKMAGQTTLQGISEWVRFRGNWVQKVLPQTRAQFPCAATSSSVLRSIDPEQVNHLLMDLLTRVRAERRRKGDQEHVILDGKTLRGTQGHLAPDQKKMHHLNLYEAKTGIILKQRMVAEKAGEQTHMQEFLTPLLRQQGALSVRTRSTPSTPSVRAPWPQMGTFCCLPSAINPPCMRICASFFANPRSIVWIGAPTR